MDRLYVIIGNRRCIPLWCKDCNRETNEEVCEFCGKKTEHDIPVIIYWCKHCKTPIINEVNRIDIDICPLCGGKTRYMASDLRPVFPEERLLLEIMVAKPFTYIEKTVWASNNRYYIDGKAKVVPIKMYKELDVSNIVATIDSYKTQNSYDFFNSTIEKFVYANRDHLNYIIDEATHFIKNC